MNLKMKSVYFFLKYFFALDVLLIFTMQCFSKSRQSSNVICSFVWGVYGCWHFLNIKHSFVCTWEYALFHKQEFLEWYYQYKNCFLPFLCKQLRLTVTTSICSDLNHFLRNRFTCLNDKVWNSFLVLFIIGKQVNPCVKTLCTSRIFFIWASFIHVFRF